MIKEIKHIRQINSTNKYLKEFSTEIDDGTLIYADYQTHGVGRRGTKWHSQSGKNLLFSFLLKESKNRPEEVLLAVALAIVKTLDQLGLKASIKLPNDILINNHKISGILIERTIYDDYQTYVIGIGLNINEIFNDGQRTSLKQEMGRSYHRLAVLKKYITAFNELFNQDNIVRFKDRMLKPTLVKYAGKDYRWLDIHKNYSVVIEKQGELLSVPFSELDFDYHSKL